ncbi:MAG: hypothetical protein PHE06_01830 [Lachnospiraceae bacterium]|nr:hypothetical protein [Lachnospiraceae bacterium]MDD3794710.1 hypothetical protein [Lachnospiraceae bacterium]
MTVINEMECYLKNECNGVFFGAGTCVSAFFMGTVLSPQMSTLSQKESICLMAGAGSLS